MDEELRKLERQGPSQELVQAYLRAGKRQEALDLRAILGYFSEVAALPLPSDIQTKRFVRYVAGAHSWYKHLHSSPTPFFFFLNPHVNCYTTSAGNKPKVEKTKWKRILRFHPTPAVKGDQALFHYSSFHTSRYIELFGHWSYLEGFAKRPKASIWSESGVSIRVPLREVAQVGLTQNVHCSFPYNWKTDGDPGELPEIGKSGYPEPAKQLAAMEKEHEAMYQAMQLHLRRISGA